MSEHKFSRLDPEQNASITRGTKGKPSRLQAAGEWILFSLLAVLVLVGGLALWAVFASSRATIPSTVDQAFESDRVNLLLVGVGGDEHPQGYDGLADAIILASLRPSTGDVALISVPRDLYVSVGRYGNHRINRAHAIGAENAVPGGGPALLIASAQRALGQRIDGYVRVDFAAFAALVDALGGVEVEVEESFYDHLFKDGFAAGRQRLNGDRALRYARYRYVDGDEGDNFARERRQQQLVTAIQERAGNLGADDLLRLVVALPKVGRYTQTNLSSGEILRLYRTFRNTEPESVRRISLEPWLEEIYIRRVFDGGEAVAPRGGDWAAVHAAVENALNEKDERREAGILRASGKSGTPPAGDGESSETLASMR